MKLLVVCFLLSSVNSSRGRMYGNHRGVTNTQHEDSVKRSWTEWESPYSSKKPDETDEYTTGSEEGTGEEARYVAKSSVLKNIFKWCRPVIYKRLRNVLDRNLGSGETSDESLDARDLLLSVYECFKILSFRYLDRILDRNQIYLTDKAYFVRNDFGRKHENGLGGKHPRGLPSLDDDKEEEEEEEAEDNDGDEYVRNILTRDTKSLIYDRLDRFFRSHSLRFQINKALQVEGRGRRRDHRMLALMVMGFMIMASILIPTGFQFLTVLGGKSLLMAKMALIMSAISGLKKIATSNVGYGFYHTGNEGHHYDHLHHGFHDKLYQVNPQQGVYPGGNL